MRTSVFPHFSDIFFFNFKNFELRIPVTQKLQFLRKRGLFGDDIWNKITKICLPQPLSFYKISSLKEKLNSSPKKELTWLIELFK